MLSADQFLDVQARLLDLARRVATLPIEEYLAVVDTCETLGPLVDPAFRQASRSVAQMRRLAQVALELQRVFPVLPPLAVRQGATRSRDDDDERADLAPASPPAVDPSRRARSAFTTMPPHMPGSNPHA